MFLQPKNLKKLLPAFFAVVVFALFIIHYSLFSARAQNFIGPTQSAGVGQGAIGLDASRNLSIGTSTPQSDTKLLIVGSSTTSGYYAIKVVDINRGPLFVVRSDGSVSIGGGYLQSNQSGSTTTISGVGTAPMNGSLFVNGPIMTSFDIRANGLLVGPIGTSTQQSYGNIYASNNITAGGTLSAANYSGTVNSGNVSSGAFGSNTGGGNYSFPSSISVGTSTAPTGGVATFMGNVGIGTTGPQSPLHIYAASGANHLRIQDSTTGAGTNLALFNHAAGVFSIALTNSASPTTDQDMRFLTNSAASGQVTAMTLKNTGNVGIGTAAPGYKLDVVGTAQFSQPVIVGTPTAAGHAATKSYVDSTVGGTIGGTATNALACSGDATCEMSGANLNGGSIVGVNKLTVTTIDPLYSINGKKYSTYAASFAGGVKEEYTGKAKLAESNPNLTKFNFVRLYEYVIDFDKVEVGSDLWVWYKAIDFSKDSVEAVATPYGQAANIWYEIIGAKITFHGDKPTEFSFRLTGKRFDWMNWPTLAPDQTEKPSLIINN